MRKNWFNRNVLLLVVLMFISSLFVMAEDVPKPENYPNKPVQFVVSWGAGGGTDIFARTLAVDVGRNLPEPLSVVNMPGANGVVGYTYVKNQPADGYTIVNANISLITDHLLGRSQVSIDDFIPIVCGTVEPGAWNVRADNDKYTTFDQLLKYAKQNPGKVRLGGAGALGIDEITTRFIMKEAGIELTYIPFESASEMHAALLGGHVDIVYEEPSAISQLVQSGDVKTLIIFAKSRVKTDLFKDVPVCTDYNYSLPPMAWRGVMVKKGTPQPIVDYLEMLFTNAMQNSTYQKYLQSTNVNVYDWYKNSADFQKIWENEYQVYKEVLGDMGMLADDK